MKIKTIDIINYRGIEKLHMEFHDGINLLIGNNGAGKTSLLSAIATLIHNPLTLIHGINENYPINDGDVYTEAKVIGDTVSSPTQHYPVEVSGYVECFQKEYLLKAFKQSDATSSDPGNYDLAMIFKDRFGDANCIFPVICFLQAGRSKMVGNSGRRTIEMKETLRSQGYQKAFAGSLNMEDIQTWCLQMELASFQKKKKIAEYEAFQQIVSEFIYQVEGRTHDAKVYYSSERNAIVYSDGQDEKPIYLLSAGYQALLCIGIELAYRAVLLNPAQREDAAHAPGIVMVDEIEMHLHPAWQWKILGALRKTFPNIQWIIATHSPIILSAAEDATLYLLKSPNEIEQIERAYGYDINDVLSLRQGSAYQPAEVSDYYRRAEDILDHGTADELHYLLGQAEEQFKDTPEIYRSLEDFVEVNRWLEDA